MTDKHWCTGGHKKGNLLTLLAVFLLFFCLLSGLFQSDTKCDKFNVVGIFYANQTTKCLRNLGRIKGEGWLKHPPSPPPPPPPPPPRTQVISLLAVPRRLFCFGSLVILDVARCYLWLFSLYINIKIGKNSC